MSYKDKNKGKGKDGFKNRRYVDIIADMFGGGTGKARDAIRKRKERTKKAGQ